MRTRIFVQYCLIVILGLKEALLTVAVRQLRLHGPVTILATKQTFSVFGSLICAN